MKYKQVLFSAFCIFIAMSIVVVARTITYDDRIETDGIQYLKQGDTWTDPQNAGNHGLSNVSDLDVGFGNTIIEIYSDSNVTNFATTDENIEFNNTGITTLNSRLEIIKTDDIADDEYALVLTGTSDVALISQAVTLNGSTNQIELNLPTLTLQRLSSDSAATLSIGNTDGAFFLSGREYALYFSDPQQLQWLTYVPIEKKLTLGDNSGTNISYFELMGKTTSEINAIQNSIDFSYGNQASPNARIVSFASTADPDQSGLAFYTHYATSADSEYTIERMRLNHLGHLLIGTENDTGDTLIVNGTANVSGNTVIGGETTIGNRIGNSVGTITLFGNITNAVDQVQNTINFGYDSQSPNAKIAVVAHGSDPDQTEMAFYTHTATSASSAYTLEAMRISQNLNLLLNTTTDTGEKLQVNGTIKATNYTVGTTQGYTGICLSTQNITVVSGIIVGCI